MSEKILIGTSGFGYSAWKGSFYPQRIRPPEMLAFYSARFRTVEINNSFYRIPSAEVIKNWGGQVPEEFEFSVKGPGKITHGKRLLDIRDELRYFLGAVGNLGPRLGALLWQLPPAMKKDLGRFSDFLSLLPREIPCAFELRHESWLDKEVLSLIRRAAGTLCVVDSDKGTLGLNEALSLTWGYLRLRRSDYTSDDLVNWARIIKKSKWKKTFVFLKHENSAAGTVYATELMKLCQESA